MTPVDERKKVVEDIKAAVTDGSNISNACNIIGISPRTFKRWNNDDTGDKRPLADKTSSKALSPEEKKDIVTTCNSPEFMDMTPNQIVPILAENGRYIACESTFYKVLKEHKLLAHRSNSKAPQSRYKPDELVATGPNQVLSWDITYLRTSVKGIFFYLYLFMDIWSRKIVGWSIAEEEDGEIASQVITDICLENDLDSIYLHSDNGSPMKCGTMLSTLNWLGVTPSFSRPSVSNDNPYSESLFKTLKYNAGYPKRFDKIDDANAWVSKFVNWYNNKHRHSGIKFVTPEQRHSGQDRFVLKKRATVYEKAKAKNPARWVGNTRDWGYIETVVLNENYEKIKIKKIS